MGANKVLERMPAALVLAKHQWTDTVNKITSSTCTKHRRRHSSQKSHMLRRFKERLDRMEELTIAGGKGYGSGHQNRRRRNQGRAGHRGATNNTLLRNPSNLWQTLRRIDVVGGGIRYKLVHFLQSPRVRVSGPPTTV